MRPPNERRHFVHKKLARAARGFVTSGFSPAGAAAGFLSRGAPRRGGRRARAVAFVETHPQSGRRHTHFVDDPQPALAIAPAVRRPAPRTLTARPSAMSAAEKEEGRALKFGNGQSLIDKAKDLFGRDEGPDDCGFGRVWDEVRGMCVFGLGQQAGRDDTPIGDVVMGRYGAGEMPGNMVVNRAICRPGMVIGDDGVCYNRTQISNRQREWPRGRRPLLTGGDMRAITVAARAGKRLDQAKKRLEKIGLMKKPAPRARRITSGPSEHHHHS